MQEGQTAKNFAKFLLEKKCVKIAKSSKDYFTLKSGKKSPIFINLGDLNEGNSLDILADAYADAINSLILAREIQKPDYIYGPAYKAISLGAITCAALFRRHKINCKLIYDRKEAKLHGDKNEKLIVGAQDIMPSSKVLIIDDVISSGKSKMDAIEKLEKISKFSLLGVIVAIDRKEKAVSSSLPCPLFSISSINDILGLLPQAQAKMVSEYFIKNGE